MVGLAQNQLVLVIVSSLPIVCALFFFIHTCLAFNSIEVQNLITNRRYNYFFVTTKLIFITKRE